MIYEKTLPNGLELIIKKTDAPVAAVQCWVDVGSIDEEPAEAGYCHFLEHMLFKGTKKRTTAEIAGEIEGSGGDMNAFTSFEHTVYHITLSNTRWKTANDILADMVLGSIFKPGEFNPEKEVILEEIKRGQDSPDRQLYQNVYESLFGKSGYGRPVIGFPKTVSACTAQKLKKFWQKWYAPALMTLVIVGDVNPAEVEAHVMKTWGKVNGKPKRRRRRELGYDNRLATPKSSRHSSHFDINSVRWAGAIPGCKTFDPRLPALDVAVMILGHGESARLHKRLFRDEKLVTSVGAGTWVPMGTGMITFDVDAPEEHLGKFRKILEEEIQKFVKEGPTQEELDRTKVLYETDRIYGAQSMEDMASRIGNTKTSIGGLQYDLEYVAQVRDLGPEEVRSAAREFLLEPMRECVVLPNKIKAEDFWKTVDMPEVKPVPVTKKQQSKAASTTPAEKVSLPNGIDLLLFPRHDLPIVAIQSAILGGLRFETKNNAGLGNLLADVWEKAPKGWTPEKTSAYLEGRASRLSSFSGRNTLGVSSVTTTKYFKDILGLFTDVLFDPALDEKEFRHSQEVTLEEIKTLEDNPARLCSKMFVENLFEDHPYGYPIIGFDESVRKQSAEAMRTYYKHTVQNSRVVIAVSGKFNSAQIIKHFEAVRRTKPSGNPLAPLTMHSPKGPRLVEVKKNREQSHLIMGFKGLTVNGPERFIMKTLLTILGGQSGRLFREIRDKQGLCYTVAPMAMEGIEPGYVGVYIGCDPSKRDAAIKGIRHELDRLMEKPVGKEELARAKEFILGRHHMDTQINGNIAQLAAFSDIYGIDYCDHLYWQDHLRKVDAKSIQKLASGLFSQPSVTAIVV